MYFKHEFSQKMEGFYPEEQLPMDPNFAQFEREWDAISNKKNNDNISIQ